MNAKNVEFVIVSKELYEETVNFFNTTPPEELATKGPELVQRLLNAEVPPLEEERHLVVLLQTRNGPVQ